LLGQLPSQNILHKIIPFAMTGGVMMIPKIKNVQPLDNYVLLVVFDDGKTVLYDVKDDMQTIPGYENLRDVCGLFQQVQLDQSRTCIFWNDYIDLLSDIIYEDGTDRRNCG
jgi:hypothetical protein